MMPPSKYLITITDDAGEQFSRTVSCTPAEAGLLRRCLEQKATEAGCPTPTVLLINPMQIPVASVLEWAGAHYSPAAQTA